MHCKAKRVARLAQMLLQNSGVIGPKVTYFFRRRGVIGGVNARIRFAILSSVVQCQRTE